MKFSAFAVVATGAVLASATPLRVIVLSNAAVQKADAQSDPFAHMRMGHAVPPMQLNNPNLAQMLERPSVAPAAHRRPGCGGLLRQKTVEIANKFRQAVGLPLIGGGGERVLHGGMIQILPAAGGPGTWVHVKGEQHQEGPGPVRGWWGHTQGGDRVEIVRPEAPEHKRPGHGEGPPRAKPCGGKKFGPPGHGPHGGPHRHGRLHHHEPSFFSRLQFAIMSLGPIEGGIVAFVIGAGMGVLLRMLFVLGVVARRGFCGSSKEYAAVEDDDDEDGEDYYTGRRRGTPISAPPTYVYPVDEKAVFEVVLPVEVDVEDVKTPVVAVASN